MLRYAVRASHPPTCVLWRRARRALTAAATGVALGGGVACGATFVTPAQADPETAAKMAACAVAGGLLASAVTLSDSTGGNLTSVMQDIVLERISAIKKSHPDNIAVSIA
jgi:hypothetical protein